MPRTPRRRRHRRIAISAILAAIVMPVASLLFLVYFQDWRVVWFPEERAIRFMTVHEIAAKRQGHQAARPAPAPTPRAAHPRQPRTPIAKLNDTPGAPIMMHNHDRLSDAPDTE